MKFGFFSIAFVMTLLLASALFAAGEFPQTTTKPDSATTAQSISITDSSTVREDTIVVIVDEGIPWNREHFDPERLVRKETFDPALKVAYTYSVSFTGGTFGSFAQQSYMAHLAYEFTPNLHLYADLGLWMPLYSNFRFNTPIAKEDVRQGNVDVVIPDITLEYKPTENTSFRLMIVNERDAFKAYGPYRYYGGYYRPWRNSILYR